jgi:hypothetical protein
MKKKKKVNPHCPVPGCQTKQPHVADPLVKALADRFTALDKMTSWMLAGMAELRDSITRDLSEGRLFAWYSRLRQPEELYFRALYILFIAKDDEVPHILSGAMPNSFADIYAKVNELVMDGRGEVLDSKPGQSFGEFRMVDTLNNGAHVAFPALQMCVMLAQHPEYVPDMQKYFKHLETYCTRLNYMRQMFEGGKSKEDVLGGVIAMHKPASYWEQKQKEAIANNSAKSEEGDPKTPPSAGPS